LMPSTYITCQNSGIRFQGYVYHLSGFRLPVTGFK
jgi:hypothetical protein